MARKTWLALVLNIFVFGLGYIYLGRKILFGILLAAMQILLVIWGIREPLMHIIIIRDLIHHPLLIAAILVFIIAISLDVYQEAKKSTPSEQDSKPEQDLKEETESEHESEQRVKKIV